jgi:hypothetical protein
MYIYRLEVVLPLLKNCEVETNFSWYHVGLQGLEAATLSYSFVWEVTALESRGVRVSLYEISFPVSLTTIATARKRAKSWQ